MDWVSLGKQVVGLGAPTIGAALGGPVGAQVGAVLATVLGVEPTPEAIGAVVADDPDRITQAEASPGSGLVPLLMAHAQMAALLAEREMARETWFSWAWRPALSWLVIFLIGWNAVFLPMLNALTGMAVPGTPWDQISAIAGMWLSIYGIGHTVKDAVKAIYAKP